MPTYNTPGVYIEEVSTLPPSVAQVATSIPAFIGYTQISQATASEAEVAVIESLLEYEQRFGKTLPTKFTVFVDGTISPAGPSQPEWLLYYAVSLFFKNGGGRCYVVSVGEQDAQAGMSVDAFQNGLEALEREDEPTLIVMPELVSLAAADHDSIVQAALAACKQLGDRFTILDVPVVPAALVGDDGPFDLSVNSTATFVVGGANVAINFVADDVDSLAAVTAGEAAAVIRAKSALDASVTSTGQLRVSTTAATLEAINPNPLGFTLAQEVTARAVDEFRSGIGNDSLAYGAAYYPYLVTSLAHVYDEAQVKLGPLAGAPTLASIASTDTTRYNQIKKQLADQRIVLPPSAALAGIYARVDRERGVWKAPANVSVSSVIGPTLQITHAAQETLNIDVNAGKSINAIRAFPGKGTLVWGARTLAGNDNEWRYIPVRRLFLMIEESAKKATSFAVFEPNDATTWLKVKGMLESYLHGLWEQGALQGASADAAFYVHVGLGKTMTAQDVLEGRMIVQIGIAAVRPAEFIVLRFSHKLATG